MVRARTPTTRAAFPDQFLDRRFLPHPGAFFAGVVKQHLVEFRAQDLPGLGDGVAVVAVEKIKRLAGAAGGGDELDAVFLDEGRGAHLVNQAEPLQGLEGEGQQGFADVIARKFFAFQDQDAMAVFGENGGGGANRRGRRR